MQRIKMSDRKNRDRGNKKAFKRLGYQCDCWLCEKAKTKKKVISKRDANKDMRQEMKYETETD